MYISKLDELIQNISTNIVDFSAERKRSSPPTQVSSEFLTNKEQGDWAEKTLLKGINDNSKQYVAVKYGRGDNIIAGEDGFKEFYEDYQNELDSVGKRPDILIFDKKDFPYDDLDISSWPIEKCDKIVPLAKCGIEVRSSAFLIDKYEAYMQEKQHNLISQALSIKEEIISNFSDLLQAKNKELYDVINMMNLSNIHVLSFSRAPSWKTTPELERLSNLIKQLKSCITEISGRTFLSITPKVEDLKVVYTWCKRYNVPHYYVQVFFDKAYGISFERILTLLASPELEGKEFFVESDVKNQNKTTIKIHATNEKLILNKISLPKHRSKMKELGRGRLLFYVEFEHSASTINVEDCSELFNIML